MTPIEILQEYSFIKEESRSLDSLKVYLGKVKHSNNFGEQFQDDIRYSVDLEGNVNGLMISPEEIELSLGDLKALFNEVKESLEVLSITAFSGELQLTHFPKLTYLNVSQSPELTTLHVDNAPNLKEIHASLCPKLTEVKLGAELNELEKLDISKSPVEMFDTATKLRKLAYFIAFETKFKQLNLAHMSRIKYLIAPNSGISEIDWTKVKSLSRIESLELPEMYDSKDDALNEIIRNVSNEFPIRINKYLSRLLNDQYIGLKRIKILLLGNTTSGKSTLRRILFSKAGEEKKAALIKEESTHGVIIENREVDTAQKVNVLLFDFGGQDYYHSTHLPFYQKDTLHWLVFKSELPEIPNAYTYGLKKTNKTEELFFPISYWLNSLKSLGMAGDSGPLVDIIQNLHENIHSKYELNNFDLKKISYLRIGDIIDFDFHNNTQNFKKWLLNRIENQNYDRIILKKDYELHTTLAKQKNIVFTIDEIIKLVDNSTTKEKVTQSLEYLHSNFLGYLVTIPEEVNRKMSSFFIRDLTQFSQWIHQILSKELISGDGQHGYFNREEATKRLRTKAAKGHIDKIITFLEKEHIIFPVKWKDDTWIAPSYLSAPKLQVEQLLLASFDEPDVKIFLPDFFHTNLIHVLIKEFKDSLVQDLENKTYLLWKNKILLYEDNKIEKSNQKAFLLLELIYPMDAEYSKYKIENSASECPVLVIRRNQSGFVAESIFAKIYQYINKHFTDKNITKEIWLKSKLGDYIPIDCLNQNNKNTYSERLQSVYYNETFYPMRDFQYFIKEGYTLPNKVFIAYSKANADLVEEFILHLQPYRERGELDFFYDKELRMGDKWDEAIKKELLDSDILVCLISPHLLNTHYVTHLELPLAVEKGKEIIPIILEDCDWMNLPIRGKDKILNEYLGEFNAPKKGEYISPNRSERQKEWNLLAKKLTLKSNDRTLSQTPGHPAGLDQPDGRE